MYLNFSYFFVILFIVLNLKKEHKRKENVKIIGKRIMQKILTYHGSRGSGSVLWTEIRSLTYWLNALFSHPSSTSFLVSAVKFVGRITGLPISPGALASGSRGATSTPAPKKKKKRKEIQKKIVSKNNFILYFSLFIFFLKTMILVKI